VLQEIRGQQEFLVVQGHRARKVPKDLQVVKDFRVHKVHKHSDHREDKVLKGVLETKVTVSF
jgi:hypothetical protein